MSTPDTSSDRPAWVNSQIKAFTGWVNAHLMRCDSALKIDSVMTDLSDGVRLLQLLELLEGVSLGKYNNPAKLKFHKMENISMALDFLRSHDFNLVGIKSLALVEMIDEKSQLGLIWMLILRYQIIKNLLGSSDSASGASGNTSSSPATADQKVASSGGASNALLEWCKHKIASHARSEEFGANIKNFTTSFQDGKAFALLTDACAPGAVDFSQVTDDAASTLQHAFDAAESKLSIPQLLDAGSIVSDGVDKQSAMTYISFFQECDNVHHADDDHDQVAIQDSKHVEVCADSELAEVADDNGVLIPALQESDSIVVIVVDSDDNVVEWNNAAQHLTGYPRDLVIGTPFPPMLHTAVSQSAFTEQCDVCRTKGGGTQPIVCALIGQDEALLQMKLSLCSWKSGAGHVLVIATPLPEATVEVRGASAILDAVDASYVVIGVDSKNNNAVVSWNDVAHRISGISADDAHGRPFVSDFVAESKEAPGQLAFAIKLAGNESSSDPPSSVAAVETLLRGVHGHSAHVSFTPCKSTNPDLGDVILVGTDNTLNRAHAAKHRMHKLVQDLAATQPLSLVWITKGSGEIVAWSDSCVQQSGYTIEDMTADGVTLFEHDVLSPKDRSTVKAHVAALFSAANSDVDALHVDLQRNPESKQHTECVAIPLVIKHALIDLDETDQPMVLYIGLAQDTWQPATCRCATFRVTPAGSIAQWSEAAESLTSTSAKDALDEPWASIIASSDDSDAKSRGKLQHNLHDAISDIDRAIQQASSGDASRRPEPIARELVSQSGVFLRVIVGSGMSLRQPDGSVQSIACSMHVIDEHAQDRKKLFNAEQQIASLKSDVSERDGALAEMKASIAGDQSNLQDTIDRQAEELAALKKQLSQSQAANTEAEASLQAASNRVKEQQAQLDSANANVLEAEQQIDLLQTELESEMEKSTEQLAAYADRLAITEEELEQFRQAEVEQKRASAKLRRLKHTPLQTETAASTEDFYRSRFGFDSNKHYSHLAAPPQSYNPTSRPSVQAAYAPILPDPEPRRSISMAKPPHLDHRRGRDSGNSDHAAEIEITVPAMLEQFLKMNGTLPVSIKASEKPNIYYFGTRRIHLVIINGRLFVRVGGGFMTMDEFCNQYGEAEAAKVKRTMQNATSGRGDGYVHTSTNARRTGSARRSRK
jgi:PAS domain-containing protein